MEKDMKGFNFHVPGFLKKTEFVGGKEGRKL
jgi:hypothetical protein